MFSTVSMVSLNQDEKEFVEDILRIEDRRKGYRNNLEFLIGTGFPSKLVSGEEGHETLQDLEEKGLLESRTVRAEVMDVQDDDSVIEDEEQKQYYSFTEELGQEFETEKGDVSGELSDRQKEFAQALIQLADTGFSAIEKAEKKLPVSLTELLDKDKEIEDDKKKVPVQEFEDPLDILESLRRKGLVDIRTEVKQRLTRDPVFSSEAGEDVYSLMETDHIIITEELQEKA